MGGERKVLLPRKGLPVGLIQVWDGGKVPETGFPTSPKAPENLRGFAEIE